MTLMAHRQLIFCGGQSLQYGINQALMLDTGQRIVRSGTNRKRRSISQESHHSGILRIGGMQSGSQRRCLKWLNRMKKEQLRLSNSFQCSRSSISFFFFFESSFYNATVSNTCTAYLRRSQQVIGEGRGRIGTRDKAP
jgi:hypothetical protein